MNLRQNKKFVSVFSLVLLIATFLFFLTQSVKANTIVVDDPSGDDVDNGLCSIVEAIINHNNADQSGSIDCAAGVGESDVISIETDITLDSVFSLDGNSTGYGIPSTNDIIINGNSHTIERDELAASFRIFTFSGFGDVEINDLTIKGGDVDGSGAGLGGGAYMSSLDVVEFNNVVFEDNIATEGGAIYISVDSSPGITLNLNNTTFTNNSVSADGGAIRLKNNLNNLNVSINGSTFTSNSSTEDGGAIYFESLGGSGTSLNIDGSTFDSNESSSIGGAIYGFNIAELYTSETDFIGNNATTKGSNIYIENGIDISISQSTFSDNPTGTGYGTYFIGSDVVFSESFFSSSDVGAIFVEDSDILIDKSSFYRMRAGLDGGSLYATNSNIDIVNSTFRRGLAFGGSGGAIYLDSTNNLNVSYSTFLENNTGGGQGGDIATGGAQTSGVIENNIFISIGYNDICYGDFTNFTFLNNLYSHNDADCSITANPVINYGDVYENGGNVETVPLLSGSNAIDTALAGTLGCPDTDARGVPRPYGDECDIGAYEYTGDVEIIIEETDDATSVSEPDGTDTYTVVLGEAPSSSVTLDLSLSDNYIDLSTSSLTFTTSNWFNPKTVTVTADDNSDVDGERNVIITHTVDTSDPDYSLLSPAEVTVTVLDDDEAPSGGGGSNPTSTGSNPTNPPRITGCTNQDATNFNSSANQDDGSCVYEPEAEEDVFGCDDINANNYSILVTVNDGSCVYPAPTPPKVYGCLDQNATNFNPSANTSDSSCTYPPVEVFGCTDSLALNFNSSANTSDGSCIYEEQPEEEIVPEEPEDIYPTENFEIPEVGGTLDNMILVAKEVLGDLSEFLKDLLQDIPEQDIQFGALAGVALPIVIFIVTQPGNLITIPARIWSVFPTLFGLKRRRRPWGTVYDSVTKQPLDPVYIKLLNENGEQVATTISDINGRFGFIVAPGKYTITANKSDYEFPSRKMFGKPKDELYDNLYFQETIEVKNEDDLLIKNIPMDPVSFNWNEFEKSRRSGLLKFFSKTDLFLSGVSHFVFIAGALLSIILVIISPTTINFLILGLYYLITFLKILGVEPRKPGHVVDSETGEPLSFGLVKIFSTNLQREVAHSVIGKTGRYYSLVPNGDYFVKIYRKTGDDSYEHVFTSTSIRNTKGYIGNKFSV